MFKLAEQRSALHRLAERRARLQLRIRKGELVTRFAANNLAVTFGRQLRNRILDSPIRHSAVIAADYQVDPGCLYVALSDVLRAECRAIADGGIADLDQAPSEEKEGPL
jgi:hypothetical protein